MRAGLRIAGLLLLALIACGFVTDLVFGLPLLFSSRSWTVWVLGSIVLGALYLVGEGGGEWINSRDQVDHPLWKRLWHLGLLLGLAVAAGTVAAAILRIAQ